MSYWFLTKQRSSQPLEVCGMTLHWWVRRQLSKAWKLQVSRPPCCISTQDLIECLYAMLSFNAGNDHIVQRCYSVHVNNELTLDHVSVWYWTGQVRVECEASELAKRAQQVSVICEKWITHFSCTRLTSHKCTDHKTPTRSWRNPPHKNHGAGRKLEE